jgi:hypothetical protein
MAAAPEATREGKPSLYRRAPLRHRAGLVAVCAIATAFVAAVVRFLGAPGFVCAFLVLIGIGAVALRRARETRPRELTFVDDRIGLTWFWIGAGFLGVLLGLLLTAYQGWGGVVIAAGSAWFARHAARSLAATALQATFRPDGLDVLMANLDRVFIPYQELTGVYQRPALGMLNGRAIDLPLQRTRPRVLRVGGLTNADGFLEHLEQSVPEPLTRLEEEPPL